VISAVLVNSGSVILPPRRSKSRLRAGLMLSTGLPWCCNRRRSMSRVSSLATSLTPCCAAFSTSRRNLRSSKSNLMLDISLLTDGLCGRSGRGRPGVGARAVLFGGNAGVEADRDPARIGELAVPAHLRADRGPFGLDNAASTRDLREDAFEIVGVEVHSDAATRDLLA